MECNKDSKQREFLVDIEIGEGNHESPAKADPDSSGEWGKKSLNKLVSGVLGFNPLAGGGLTASSVEYPNETTKLLAEECDQVNVDKKRSGKVKKAPKPPRPPRGPSLDASDVRMIKEFSKIAMKKRERIKSLKKMRAAKMASSSTLSSSGSTILATGITVLFFLVMIFQGLGSSTSPNRRLNGAPQPAPETRGVAPVLSYKSFLSDDGAAPSFLPPESTQ